MLTKVFRETFRKFRTVAKKYKALKVWFEETCSCISYLKSFDTSWSVVFV